VPSYNNLILLSLLLWPFDSSDEPLWMSHEPVATQDHSSDDHSGDIIHGCCYYRIATSRLVPPRSQKVGLAYISTCLHQVHWEVVAPTDRPNKFLVCPWETSSHFLCSKVKGRLSYPVFMPKPCTHHIHNPGSNVPHIRPIVFTDNHMSRIKYNYYISNISKDYDDSQWNGTVEDSITLQERQLGQHVT
jgi:hypothetical protein